MKAQIIYITIISLLFSSCGVNRLYTPGSYGSGGIKSYTVRPIYKDTIVSETYISGNISRGVVRHIKSNSISFNVSN